MNKCVTSYTNAHQDKTVIKTEGFPKKRLHDITSREPMWFELVHYFKMVRNIEVT